MYLWNMKHYCSTDNQERIPNPNYTSSSRCYNVSGYGYAQLILYFVANLFSKLESLC